MAQKKPKPEPTQPTQPTQPYGKDDEGKPAKPETIPVPTRGEFFRDLKKLATGKSLSDEPETDTGDANRRSDSY